MPWRYECNRIDSTPCSSLPRNVFDSNRPFFNLIIAEQVTKAAILCRSRTGKTFRAVNSQKDNKDVPTVEVSDADGSLALRIDASEIHGKVCGDDWFG